MVIAYSYTAVRVLFTATTAVRVPSTSGPRGMSDELDHPGQLDLCTRPTTPTDQRRRSTTPRRDECPPRRGLHRQPRSPTSSPCSTTAPETEYSYPTGRVHPDMATPGRYEDEHCHPGQPQHGLACRRDPPPRVCQVGHPGRQLPPHREDSTDVSNPYRKVCWTDKAPQPS